MTAARPDLLFIVPTMPQRTGNGLAMRAGQMLAALARHFTVHLFIVPVAGGAIVTPDFVASLVHRVGVLDLAACIDTHAGLIARVQDPTERHRHRLAYPRPWLSRFCTPAASRQLAAWMAPAQPAAVHVMRLYLAPLAASFQRSAAPPLSLLDLDDDETTTRHGLAALHTAHGDAAQAILEQAEAAKYATLAEHVLADFDRVITCSHEDAARLAARHKAARFVVLPNVYAAETPPDQIRSPVGPTLRLLLLGNLGYLPNAGAARFLAGDILAALRRHKARVRIDIVGGGDAGALPAAPEVRVHGAVDSVAPYYAQADIAVVPLRAGGGTRIKILEAFAHGVPVIATGIGAEGLDLQPGRHFLRADDAESFASACLRLRDDPALAASLVTHAAALLRDRHSPVSLQALLRAILADVKA